MSGLSDTVEAWRRHCASFTTLAPGDGTVIHRQGEPWRHVYVLGSGYLKREAVDKAGNESIRVLMSRGDFFGALGDVAGSPAPDSVVCKGSVRLYRCRARDCHALIDSHPGVAHAVLANLERQLAFARQQSDLVLHSPVEERIAAMLYRLAGHHGGTCRHGHEIDVRLTQQEMAELVGATRPVVSTVLNDLRRRGIIGYTRAFLCIESMETLRGLLPG